MYYVVINSFSLILLTLNIQDTSYKMFQDWLKQCTWSPTILHHYQHIIRYIRNVKYIEKLNALGKIYSTFSESTRLIMADKKKTNPPYLSNI